MWALAISGLIVLVTHARTGLAHLAMRSIAEDVLRHGTVPLYIVRRPRIGMIDRRLLVPIVDDGLTRA